MKESLQRVVNLETLKMLSRLWMFGIYLTFFATFLMAYISPLKKVTVSINAIGEANIELAMLSLFLPLFLYTVRADMKKYLKEAK